MYDYSNSKHTLVLLPDFDLEKERTILDEQGLRIAENQENSQKNRRKLAESTRGIVLHFDRVLWFVILFSRPSFP